MAKLIVSWKKKRWLARCPMASTNVDKSAVANKRAFFNIYIYIKKKMYACVCIKITFDSMMCL